MDFILSLLSSLGVGGILLFLIKRYFDQRDKAEAQRQAARAEKDAEFAELMKEVKTGMDTLRLLSYARMSEEIERLLSKGFATPAERRVLDEMYHNYKDHGWNGDMDARLKKVYALRTDHAPE